MFSQSSPPSTSRLVVNTMNVDVKSKGEKGDGVTGGTAALQTVIDQVGGTGGIVLVPDEYLINVLTYLKLKSNMTLKMESGAILKAIPNNSGNYSIIPIGGVPGYWRDNLRFQ